MSDLQDKNERQPVPAQPIEREVPLDTRLLSEAIIELNISRKNVGIYPPGHIQITRSIDSAYEILLKVFEIRSEITLGVAKDTLLVGQDYLDRKNPVYRDFALSLNHQGIAAVTFSAGLDKDELIRFHRILTTKPDVIAADGGILHVMSGSHLSHITVKAIDYNAFHLTEEDEILQGKVGNKGGAGLWQDFVSHLSGDTLARPGQDPGISLKDAEQVDPLELARLLNERKLDPTMAVESYDRIISTHVRGTAEKKQLTREQSDTIRNLNNLLKNLQPDLRKQFLSVAFQRTADASSAATEEILGGLSDSMVIEMIQHANAEGKEISPTLTGLVSKLSSVSSSGPVTAAAQQAAATPELMKKLFEREQYESYVSTEYASTLKHLTTQQPATEAVGVEEFDLAEHIASIKDEHLDFQIGRVALAFIDEDLEDDDYGEFLKKSLDAVPGFIQTENFGIIHDILETLRMHSKDKKSMVVRSMADMALKTFESPGFVSKIIDAVGMCSKNKAGACMGLLLALGPKAIPLVLDQYALDDTPGGKRSVFDLLCRFGNAAVKEAATRLQDRRPYYVRNLLMLVRWGWDASVLPQVRPLLKHKDSRVKHEALTTMLRFKDPAAIPALRDALTASDPDEVSAAIKLAGQFRVEKVVDVILTKIKKVVLFETDYLINEEIILALGEIGDPHVLPELEKLARASWTLYPKALARMKAELFESLEKYPRGSIGRLLSIGEQLENERVRRACAKIKETAR